MPDLIIVQPDGHFAVYRTEIEDFMAADMDEDLIIEYEAERAAEASRWVTRDRLQRILTGQPEAPGTLYDWIDRRNAVHGPPSFAVDAGAARWAARWRRRR